MPIPSRTARLLDTRICDLGLELEGSWLAPQVSTLHRELARVGLVRFRPRVYLGDEWFSPEGLPAIAAPFYLAHPRLMRLEQRFARAVEGGTPAFCRKLLRHEAGHCFDHAYRVSRRPEWRRLFGDPRRKRYDPDAHVGDPARAHEFVANLPGLYAQAHPDEDFAETFAVVVAGGAWETAYRSKPVALAKLRYVAALIAEHGQILPRARDDGSTCYAAKRMRLTLRRFYARRAADEARITRRKQRPH